MVVLCVITANTGASFTGETLIETVAVPDNDPSLALNVKLSLPLKSASGV